jgi:hypothetical protein
MSKFDQWPMWLQLLFGIPNAIVASVLMIWWPKDEQGWNKYGKIAIPYFVVVLLFYFFFLK